MTDPERVEEYWDWLAAALFLLVTVDMLTSLLAAAELGVDAEANPLVRWAIDRGLPTLIAVNLAAVVVVVGLFRLVVETLHRTPPRYRRSFGLLVELWLGLLLVAGLFVLANNLTAIVLGESLV